MDRQGPNPHGRHAGKDSKEVAIRGGRGASGAFRRSSENSDLVLIRIWRTQFDETRRDELRRFAADISSPMFREMPGCAGHIYAFQGSTWITQTFWEETEAIEKAEQSIRYQEVVRQLADTGVLRGSPTIEVFVVDALDLHAGR